MPFSFRKNVRISVDEFRSLLERSTLGERRPLDNQICLEGMLEHANLIISVWDGETLVGIARSMTDFHYACYLSDLAVDSEYQRQGLGQALLKHTADALEAGCKIILIAAPSANHYYEPLGFERSERCWVYQKN